MTSYISYKNLGIVLLVILTTFSFFIAYGLLQSSYRVTNIGHIKTVGVTVYSNESCKTPVTEIEWGCLEPGQTENKTVYVKNEGTITVRLSHLTENWDPQFAKDYIFFSWDGENQTLNAGQVIQVTLTLSVDENISDVDTFSFDIIIMGTEITEI